MPALALGASAAKGAWQVTAVEKVPLHVYVPAGEQKRPLVIALPGWNHTPELWRQKSDLGPLAEKYGVVIAMPAMGKSVYETKFYAETKSSWSTAPGTPFIGEKVLPFVREKLPVLTERASTALLGYSTGGRGAVLVAEAYAEQFSFAGSVSGTYDLMRLPPADGEYKIHAAMYGARDQFKDRWELDNIVTPARLDQLASTKLYVAHGDKDNVVKPDQLEALRDALKGREVAASFTLVPGAGHDWKLWSSQWEPMMNAWRGTP